jgi:hypothetical protein
MHPKVFLNICILVAVFAVSCKSIMVAKNKIDMSRVSNCMEEYNISLQVGNNTVTHGPGLQDDLSAALKSHNLGACNDGLDKELCPGFLSEKRVLAFLGRLPELEVAQLQAMAGKSINLAFAKLYLAYAYPVDIEEIEKCNLEVKPSNSPFVRPTMLISFNQSEATRLAEKAHAATKNLDETVKKLQAMPEILTETDGKLKNQLKTAEISRFYAATVWLRNAEILSKDLQLDTWANEAQMAKEAVAAYQVLVSAGMPTH